MNTDEKRERQRRFAVVDYMRENKTGFYPIGGMIFMKKGVKYDLSAADVTQWERIEREGLFVVEPPDYPIIKISGTAVSYPCDQYAKILKVTGYDELVIELLGTGCHRAIKPTDVVGVKLSDKLTINFNVTGVSYS